MATTNLICRNRQCRSFFFYPPEKSGDLAGRNSRRVPKRLEGGRDKEAENAYVT